MFEHAPQAVFINCLLLCPYAFCFFVFVQKGNCALGQFKICG